MKTFFLIVLLMAGKLGRSELPFKSNDQNLFFSYSLFDCRIKRISTSIILPAAQPA